MRKIDRGLRNLYEVTNRALIMRERIFEWIIIEGVISSFLRGKLASQLKTLRIAGRSRRRNF